MAIRKSIKFTILATYRLESQKETALRAARQGVLDAQHPYRELAKDRIYVEHVIHCLKIFRILAQPYAALMRHRLQSRLGKQSFPHRRRRFKFRFNLISGLYNRGLELAIA